MRAKLFWCIGVARPPHPPEYGLTGLAEAFMRANPHPPEYLWLCWVVVGDGVVVVVMTVVVVVGEVCWAWVMMFLSYIGVLHQCG